MPDFDFKEKFPISQYINGVIEKRKIEEASKQAGRQSILAGIDSIVNDGVAYKAKRQAEAETLARAAILANQNPELTEAFGGGRQIGNRLVPPSGGGMGPSNQVPVTAMETQGGRDKVIGSLAKAISGVSGKDVLDYTKSKDALFGFIPMNRSTGEVGSPVVTKAPKGSRIAVSPYGSLPNQPTASLRESNYVDEDGTPLTFVPSTGQRIRPDGTVAKKPVLRKGDESAIGDVALISAQAPNIDKVFDAYKSKRGISPNLQASPIGYVLDPEVKQMENSLKLAAFTFGGKNLTGQEKEVVFGALFPKWTDSDAARENKRNLLKDYFSGKVDLLQAANILGPAGKPMREMLKNKLNSNVPKVGDVKDGFRFKGGNPGDRANWEKI